MASTKLSPSNSAGAQDSLLLASGGALGICLLYSSQFPNVVHNHRDPPGPACSLLHRTKHSGTKKLANYLNVLSLIAFYLFDLVSIATHSRTHPHTHTRIYTHIVAAASATKLACVSCFFLFGRKGSALNLGLSAVAFSTSDAYLL